MAVVWVADGALMVGEVHAGLPATPPVAYNTVKTTLERLARKGIVARERQGRAYVYRAAVSRDELERRIVAGALERLVEQFPQAMASYFVEPGAQLSSEKRAILLAAIERHEAGRDG